LICNSFGLSTLSVKVSVPASEKSQDALATKDAPATLVMFLLNFTFSNTFKYSRDVADFNAAAIY